MIACHLLPDGVMNIFPLPRPASARRLRPWAFYAVTLVLIHVVCFYAWLVVLIPNTSQPRRPLVAQAAYAWGWVWINTHSGIYRQHLQLHPHRADL